MMTKLPFTERNYFFLNLGVELWTFAERSYRSSLTRALSYEHLLKEAVVFVELGRWVVNICWKKLSFFVELGKAPICWKELLFFQPGRWVMDICWKKLSFFLHLGVELWTVAERSYRSSCTWALNYEHLLKEAIVLSLLLNLGVELWTFAERSYRSSCTWALNYEHLLKEAIVFVELGRWAMNICWKKLSFLLKLGVELWTSAERSYRFWL